MASRYTKSRSSRMGKTGTWVKSIERSIQVLKSACKATLLSATCENNFRELSLSFGNWTAFAFFLPVVDHFGRFVKQFNAIGFRDPMFGFEFSFHLFPSVIPGPEVVAGEGASAFSYNLVNGQCYVFV